MGNKLSLTILFMMLCWMFVGTYAQSTTVAPTTTSNMTTTTAAPTTTNTMSTTTAAPTTNNTMSTTTAAPTTNNTMTTTTGPPTTAPPLTANTTVETLETEVNNSQCGTQQLCAAEPASCNPATSESCFFLAVKQQSGQNFEFKISGVSSGYLAASLSGSSQGGNDSTFVCANNNGIVTFFSTVLNNGQLVQRELPVNSVRGKVSGSTIQCTFLATVSTSATRNRATNVKLGILNGTFNSDTNALGAPSTILQSSVVDLADPTATVTNQVSPTSPTTSHGATFQQSLMPALLISVGVLSLAIL